MAEISLNIVMHPNYENMEQFYFNADISVQEAKQLILCSFQMGDEEVNPNKFTLYRVDGLDEPKWPLRRMKAPLTK